MTTVAEQKMLRVRPPRARSAGHDPAATARAMVAAAALIGFGAAVLVAWIAQAGVVGVVAAAAIAAGVGAVALAAIRRVAADGARGMIVASPTVASLDSAAPPCAISDSAGIVLDANQPFWRAFARGSPERIGDLAVLAADPAAARAALDMMGRATDPDAAGELLRLRVAERERCYRVSARHDADGRRVLWRFDDVTEDQMAISAAGREAALYRALLDRLPVGICHLDGDGLLKYANARLAALLRLGAEQLGAGTWRWSTLADEVVAAPDPAQPALLDLRDADGGRHPVTYYEAALPDGDPASGTLGVSIPRMARPGESTPAEVGERFSDAVQRAPVGIVLLDPQGTITYANPAFGRVAMVGEAEPGAERKLRGQPLIAFVADGSQENVAAHLRDAIAAGEAAEAIDVAWRAKQTVIVSMVFTPMTARDGTIDSVLATVVDVTTQRQLEQQFTQAQKMQAVGQLAGGVAHDFNNLLTAMIGFCDLLLGRMVPGDQSYEDVDQILQNANRAANLVRQLLAFSRKQTMTPRVANLTDTVAELGHMMRRLLGDGIELDIVYTRDLWPVKVDESQLQHVIINLAVNARDAMAGQGDLTIQTSNFPVRSIDDAVHEAMPLGDYVRIAVTDTGIGMGKDVIDRIWEPFFTTKELGEGTGLGLSTCYGIIKQTGGFIFAESALGEGSTFSVYLPRHVPQPGDDQPARDAGPRKARDLTGAGRVLLVEDEDAVRLFSTRALRNKGYEVLAANGGGQALELLDEADNKIDLLITDVMMPEMDGPTLIRHVRERIPDIKAICISGYAEDALRDRLADDTDIHFLAKPFNLQDLATMVKEVLEDG